MLVLVSQGFLKSSVSNRADSNGAIVLSKLLPCWISCFQASGRYLLPASKCYLTALFYMFFLIISNSQPLFASAEWAARSKLPDPYNYVFIAETHTVFMQWQEGADFSAFQLPSKEEEEWPNPPWNSKPRRWAFRSRCLGSHKEIWRLLHFFNHLMVFYLFAMERQRLVRVKNKWKCLHAWKVHEKQKSGREKRKVSMLAKDVMESYHIGKDWGKCCLLEELEAEPQETLDSWSFWNLSPKASSLSPVQGS